MKPGPKPHHCETMQRHSVRLTAEQWDWCCAMGGKEGSGAFIRLLIRKAMLDEQMKRRRINKLRESI